VRIENVQFMAQCLDCRGKPSVFTSWTDREVWATSCHAGHSVHVWLEAPSS
jgi:hypothetical protein